MNGRRDKEECLVRLLREAEPLGKPPQHRQDLLDRLDEIATCLEAVEKLLIPDLPLQQNDRGDVAILLGFLRREYRQALERLHTA